MTIGDLFGWAFLIVLCLFGGWIAWQMFLHPHREGLPYLGRDLAKAYLWHSTLADLPFKTAIFVLIPLSRSWFGELFGLAEGEEQFQFTLLLYSVVCISYWAYHKFAPYPRQIPTNPVVHVAGLWATLNAPTDRGKEKSLTATIAGVFFWGTVLLAGLWAIVFDTQTEQGKEKSLTVNILGVLFWGAILLFPFYYVFIHDLPTIVSNPYALLSRLLLALSVSLLVSIEASPWQLVIGEDGVNINGRFMAWERFGHWLWNPIPEQQDELLLVNPTMSRLWRIPLGAQSRTAVEDALEQRLGRPHLPHLENE